MEDYRNPPLGELCVAIRTAPSTYWLRVGATFKARWRGVRWYLWLASFVSIGGIYLLLHADEPAFLESPLAFTGYVATRTTLLILGIWTVIGLLRSIVRSEWERFLPRALVFTESTVLVTDSEGRESDEGWSMVQEATLSASKIILVLGREPLQTLQIRPTTIGQAPFELLTRWLRAKTTTTTTT